MKVVVISLRGAMARREHVRREMDAAGVQFEFLDAVEGEAGRQYFSGESWLRYRINSRRMPLPGEIGCYASHLSAWRYCSKLAEPLLVLEDDFRLSPKFAGMLDTLESLTLEYGFIRLESLERQRLAGTAASHRSRQKVYDDHQRALYYLSDVPLNLLAYTISPPAAMALAQASQRLDAPVDKFIQRTWEHRVPLFGLAPPVVSKSDLAAKSTIGCRQRKSWNPLLLSLRAMDKVWGRIRRRRFNHINLHRLLGSDVR